MFTLVRKEEGYLPAAEYLPGNADEVYTVGEALVLGKSGVTACGATQKPEYISLGSRETANNTDVYVMPVCSDAVYRTTNSEDLSGIETGDMLTLANSIQITANKTDGVAKLIYKSGNDAGSEIHVKF